MAEYQNKDGHVEKSGGLGRTLAIIALVAGIIAAVLFATGFWKLNASGGALPQVDVSTKGGEMPKVDLDSKSVVVGTKETTVDVPKVTTEKETISVPAIGVTEGETDKK